MCAGIRPRYCRSVTPFGERIVFADMSSEQVMLSHLLQTCAVIAVLCFAAFLLISWLLAGGPCGLLKRRGSNSGSSWRTPPMS